MIIFIKVLDCNKKYCLPQLAYKSFKKIGKIKQNSKIYLDFSLCKKDSSLQHSKVTYLWLKNLKFTFFSFKASVYPKEVKYANQTAQIGE